MDNLKKIIFIIGAPRSGTTWLQSMMGAHPSVCTTTEFPVFGNYIVPMTKKYNQEKNDPFPKGLPMIWDYSDFKLFLIEFLNNCFKGIDNICAKQGQVVLIKDPYNVFYLDTIVDLLPNSKLIHIIRDGRSAALSFVESKKELGFGRDSIKDSILHWKHCVENGLKGRRYNNYFEIRYENLIQDTTNKLIEIFKFCEIEQDESIALQISENFTFDKMKNRGIGPDQKTPIKDGFWRKGRSDSWIEELTTFDKYLIHKYGSDLLSDLGYIHSNKWWYESKIFSKYFAILRYYFHRFTSKIFKLIQILKSEFF